MMDEQATRFAVLLEDVDRKLGVVTESNQALAEALADMKADSSRRFDAIDMKLVGMTIEMRDLKAEVGRIAGKADGLDTKVDNLDTKVDNLDTKVDKLETKVDNLDTKVDNLETKVDKLETKVDKLETKVDKLDTKVDKLEAKVDKLDTKVDKLEEFATDAGPRLVRIEAHLALPAVPPRRERTRRTPSKHHRRKPTKRN